MCAPSAIARGLAWCGVDPRPTARDVQREVTGSEKPAAWHAKEFITAARRYRVVITTYRPGFPTQCIGAGTREEVLGAPRIFLDMHVKGTHVDHYGNAPSDALAQSREASQYVDVGTEGEALKGHLTVFQNANASGGRRPRCDCCGRVGALSSGCSPTWREGHTGHPCARVGGCMAPRRGPAPADADGRVASEIAVAGADGQVASEIAVAGGRKAAVPARWPRSALRGAHGPGLTSSP